MMRYLFLCVMIFSFASVSAQAEEKENSLKKVLIIPYHRFEFHTEFSLQEIANINDTISTSQIYELYKSSLIDEFTSLTGNCHFVVPRNSDIHYLWQRVDYKYSKEPSPHFRAFPDKISMKKYKELHSVYETDYILFINWYHIEKDIYHLNSGSGSSRQKYSKHYVDYDVYDKDKTLITSKGRKEIDGEVLSRQMINRKKLKVSDFSYQYQNLAGDICKGIIEAEKK